MRMNSFTFWRDAELPVCVLAPGLGDAVAGQEEVLGAVVEVELQAVGAPAG